MDGPWPLQVLAGFDSWQPQVLAGVKFGEQISSHYNFDTTLDAFQALFVMATGSGFSGTLRDVSVAEPLCTRCSACDTDLNGDPTGFSDCGVPGSQVALRQYAPN